MLVYTRKRANYADRYSSLAISIDNGQSNVSFVPQELLRENKQNTVSVTNGGLSVNATGAVKENRRLRARFRRATGLTISHSKS